MEVAGPVAADSMAVAEAAPPLDPAAQWLAEAIQHGVSCALVQGHKNLGRHGAFEDACIKSRLTFTNRFFELEAGGLQVQLKELKSVERSRERPKSPVFRAAEGDVPRRLVTVRWDKTGERTQSGQYAHLLFPTAADSRAFGEVLEQVRRFGVTAVRRGSCPGGEMGALEPTPWQIERGRELFARVLKRWRGQRLGWSSEGPLARDAAPSQRPASEVSDEDFFFSVFSEDSGMYERWETALSGRGTADLSMDELQTLIDGGMPLKYRHQLWRLWTADPDVGSVDELQESAAADACRQIELDIPRTYPGYMSDHQRKSLQHVLRAYAARNPETGYCQGMNFIAMVFLVLGFDESATFAGLTKILEDICPKHHNRGLEGYVRDTAVLGVLVHRHLPAEHARLESFDMPLNILAMDHFLSLSARFLPLGPTVRLWDMILSEGSPALFASFLAMLELYLPCAFERRASAQGEEELTDADVMDRFKDAVRRGVIEDEGQALLKATRRWIPLTNQERIDRLREEITSTDDPAS